MEAIVTLQLNGTDVTVGKLFTSIRRGIESAISHTIRPICALQTQYPSVQRCPSPPERSRPSIMRCIASFKTACRIVGAGTSCFAQNVKMLVRSIAQHVHYLRETSYYPSTMRPDKAHCASGTTTVTR